MNYTTKIALMFGLMIGSAQANFADNVMKIFSCAMGHVTPYFTPKILGGIGLTGFVLRTADRYFNQPINFKKTQICGGVITTLLNDNKSLIHCAYDELNSYKTVLSSLVLFGCYHHKAVKEYAIYALKELKKLK